MPSLITMLVRKIPNGTFDIKGEYTLGLQTMTDFGEADCHAISVPLVIDRQLGAMLPFNSVALCMALLPTILGMNVPLDPVPYGLESVSITLYKERMDTPVYATMTPAFSLVAVSKENTVMQFLAHYTKQIFTSSPEHLQARIQNLLLIAMHYYLIEALPDAFRANGNTRSKKVDEQMQGHSTQLGKYWEHPPKDFQAQWVTEIQKILDLYHKALRS